MGVRFLLHACLLTAFLVLGVTNATATDSSNAEAGTQPGDSTQEQTPCTIIVIGTEQPIVDVHPECMDPAP